MSEEQQTPQKTLSQLIEDISYKFEQDRNKTSKRVRDNVSQLSDIKKLANIKIDLLTLRQELIENSHALNQDINKYRSTYYRKKANELETISKNQQVRYSPYEKKDLVNSKLANLNKLIEIYEKQVAFYDDTIRTIDKSLYGTKIILDWHTQLGF